MDRFRGTIFSSPARSSRSRAPPRPRTLRGRRASGRGPDNSGCCPGCSFGFTPEQNSPHPFVVAGHSSLSCADYVDLSASQPSNVFATRGKKDVDARRKAGRGHCHRKRQHFKRGLDFTRAIGLPLTLFAHKPLPAPVATACTWRVPHRAAADFDARLTAILSAARSYRLCLLL